MPTDEFIPFALPSIGEAEIQEVVDTMRSGWLTTGPKTRRLEEEFADYIGARYALAVNSATAGLHLALEAAGIGPGDEVATTVFTFTATAEVIRYLGADPVFVDVDPITFNLCPDSLANKLACCSNVKAIIPVHFAGQSCEMNTIQELALKNKLAVIEDAAHAFPSTYLGKKIGTLGDATTFSFYATKTLTTGEGGMIVTDKEAWAKRIRTMRLHGISTDAFDRYTSNAPAWYYEVIAPGFKYNMPDLAAAIGLHQLRRAEELHAGRESIARAYDEAFQGLPLTTPVRVRNEDTHAWHLYVIQLQLDKLKIDRDSVINKLAERGVGTSVHFIPLHLQPYWRDRYRLSPADFPVALALYQRVISLPIYPGLSDASVRRVIDAVCDVVSENVR